MKGVAIFGHLGFGCWFRALFKLVWFHGNWVNRGLNMSDRKAELERKRKRLEEIRKAREDKKKVSGDGGVYMQSSFLVLFCTETSWDRNFCTHFQKGVMCHLLYLLSPAYLCLGPSSFSCVYTAGKGHSRAEGRSSSQRECGIRDRKKETGNWWTAEGDNSWWCHRRHSRWEVMLWSATAISCCMMNFGNLTLSLPRVINFKFPLQSHQKY